MSRTTKSTKGPGAEYWQSRLHRHGEIPGRETKTLTHRKERREGKPDPDTALDEDAPAVWAPTSDSDLDDPFIF